MGYDVVALSAYNFNTAYFVSLDALSNIFDGYTSYKKLDVPLLMEYDLHLGGFISNLYTAYTGHHRLILNLSTEYRITTLSTNELLAAYASKDISSVDLLSAYNSGDQIFPTFHSHIHQMSHHFTGLYRVTYQLLNW